MVAARESIHMRPRRAHTLLRLLTIAAWLLFPACVYLRCEVERWDVNTGTDCDVAQVDLSAPQSTTIAHQPHTHTRPVSGVFEAL